jgi:hypothetical protein
MKALISIAVLGLAAAGSAYGACSYPQPPTKMPDGNTATMEDMQAAAKAVRQYDADINAYVACLKLEHDQSVAKDGASLSDDRRKEMERMQVQKHNAAIDELESVAARFNEQVKVFKAKNDKKKG